MNEPRFDMYSVVIRGKDYHVVQLSKGVPMVVAQVLAGVNGQDFTQSVINTGWVGTCPGWGKHLPIVALPRGERLGVDQLDFMLESLTNG
jgi:hypothetical protein